MTPSHSKKLNVSTMGRSVRLLNGLTGFASFITYIHSLSIMFHEFQEVASK